tara:strand:+ start:1812 stop:2873 length:1062 start_codon:yes stop_codon:yes gene_type:complete
MSEAIKVLIIDDSAVVRQVLTKILGDQPDIEVVAACIDPLYAREKIKALKPDVITLDIEMPRMDGLTFLDKLMRLHPLPVVMISTLTDAGADATLKALELGAIDFVSKPKSDTRNRLTDEYAEEVIAKVRMAAKSRVCTRQVSNTMQPSVLASVGFKTTESIVAIGASTGGIEAIKAVLMQMPADAPRMVITQHIPAPFAGPFAERMNRCCRVSVALAKQGQQILPGHAYIAPGDQHLEVRRDGARFTCHLGSHDPVNRHCPSVEVLFDSVAKHAGQNAIGVMLTGMGKDGAEAMLRLRQTGARTIAQDEASSVVWGMPGEAVKIGAAELQAPLHKIPQIILKLLSQQQLFAS